MEKTASFEKWTWVIVLLMICFISRIPQLISPNLILDGDEAVVGLMAKHFIEGREFPVFFYGQNYGLSFFEAGAAAVFFQLFGISDVSLKLSALLLWSTGAVFLFLTLRNLIQSKWLPFILITVFVLSPAWAVWSMKARGGYVTAFMLFALFTWLVSSPRKLEKKVTWVLLGSIVTLIYYAQPLWIPAILVIGAFIGWKQKEKLVKGILFLAGLGTIFLLLSLAPTQSSWWNPKVLSGFNNTLLIQLPEHLYNHLTGFYHFAEIYQPPAVVKFVVGLILTLLLAGVVFFIQRMVKKEKSTWGTIFFLSLLATFVLTLFMIKGGGSPRYFLPVSALMLLWLSLELQPLYHFLKKNKWVARATATTIVFVLMSSMLSFKAYSNVPDFLTKKNEKKQLMKLIRGLQSSGIRYAVTTRGMQQWIIMFYSKEKIICRYTSLNDRYPPYVKEVNNALDRGEAIAIVGYNGVFRGIHSNQAIMQSTTFIEDKYFYFPYAQKGLIEALRYEF